MELREMDGGKKKIVIYSAFHANVNKLMKMETKVSLTTNEVEWKKIFEKIMMNDYGKYAPTREKIGKQSNTHKLIKLKYVGNGRKRARGERGTEERTAKMKNETKINKKIIFFVFFSATCRMHKAEYAIRLFP